MLSYFSNPRRFIGLATRLEPVVITLTAALFFLGLMFGLVLSPADYQQGDTVRLMYIHVPAATLALGVYMFIAFMSAIAFVWRHTLADLAARRAAPVGAAFTFLALFTGAVWGKPTWGAWWVWDARLTSMLVLLFIYLGYLAVWRSSHDPMRTAKFARIVALVGVVNIPIIKFSVDWWNSLHQPASLLRAGGPSIHSSMLTPLFLMMSAYACLFIWLVFTGVRLDLEKAQIRRRRARAPSRPISHPSKKGQADD